MIWVAVAVAGACGAVARYLANRLVPVVAGAFPWATLAVNVSGSFAAGVVVGLVARYGLPDGFTVVVVGGFLGAYTTFSTAMHDTLRLLGEGRHALAALNWAVPLLVSVAAAGAGLRLVA